MRRNTARLNPRLRLRKDAVFTHDGAVIKAEDMRGGAGRHGLGDPYREGQFWQRVTFWDPAVLAGAPPGLHYIAAVDWASRHVIGGVWAYWRSENEHARGAPGVVEYIAAGPGFGPDVVETAANEMGPLALSPRSTFASRGLFAHYPESIVGSRFRHTFQQVEPTDIMDDAMFDVKIRAAWAYNQGSGSSVLSRYEDDDDGWRADMSKVQADRARK